MALYLVDGHALAYRSYYAFIRRPLVNAQGEETSAVFGFLKTLLNLLDKFDPSHIAVVFDSSEETFRNQIYPEYKANRERMPDSLIAQIPKIFDLLDAMHIPMYVLPGYEADDVIATFSKAMEKKTEVKIVSGDKDLLQLVSTHTHVIRPGKTGLLEDEIDGKRLEGDFGLRAEQFVDFQALMGDPSDNIPGVRGVGEKTALKLIRRYGTLEKLYENLAGISSASLREKLDEGREQAFLSRELVKLNREVPLEVSLAELGRKPFDREKLKKLLEELDFTRLLQDLELDAGGGEELEESPVAYGVVDTEEGLAEVAAALRRGDEFAIDVEASGLDPMRATLAGVSFAVRKGVAWYVPVRSAIGPSEGLLTPPQEAPGLPIETVVRHVGAILEDPEKRKIGQNIKYDALVLTNAGLKLEGIHFDTMLASYCLHPARKSHGLDSLAGELLGHRMIPFDALFDSKTRQKDIRTVALKKVVDYACEDADFTLRLKEYFDPLLKMSQVNELFTEVEMPLCRVLIDMELTGVRLDVGFLGSLSAELSGKLSELEESIYIEAGERFNINSTPRLREILFGKIGLKPAHKTKTGFSTDMDVLKTLAAEHELPRFLLEYRTLAKLKNTYIDALPRLVHPRTGRVHTSYNQAVTSTGRLSSSEPNLQNIPIRTPVGRKIRRAFVAGGDGWVLLDADYSQVELRILAHLSRDAELLRAFVEGADVHSRTAARIMGVAPEEVSEEMRSRAKTVNFGIIYGMGARGLAQSLGIEVQEARKFIDDYFAGYPGVRRFIDETIRSARRDKAVSTLLGRVRHLPDMDATDSRSRSFAERTAVNTRIQGTAADIIKVAMVRIHERFQKKGLKAKMILQVHDELLFDLPEKELETVKRIVRDCMENAIRLDVPLKIDIGVGANWLEAHD